MGIDQAQLLYPQHSYLDEWAESNNVKQRNSKFEFFLVQTLNETCFQIIVLYPQATSSQLFPFNPNGCWDW